MERGCERREYEILRNADVRSVNPSIMIRTRILGSTKESLYDGLKISSLD